MECPDLPPTRQESALRLRSIVVLKRLAIVALTIAALLLTGVVAVQVYVRTSFNDWRDLPEPGYVKLVVLVQDSGDPRMLERLKSLSGPRRLY